MSRRPRHSRRHLARIVVDMVAEYGLQPAAASLAAYLTNSWPQLDINLLMRDVADVLQRRHGVLTVRLESTRALHQQLEQQLLDYLRQQHDAAEVIAQHKRSPQLIGGIRMTTPDTTYDWSAAAKLNRLKVKRTT